MRVEPLTVVAFAIGCVTILAMFWIALAASRHLNRGLSIRQVKREFDETTDPARRRWLFAQMIGLLLLRPGVWGAVGAGVVAVSTMLSAVCGWNWILGLRELRDLIIETIKILSGAKEGTSRPAQ
jgi:hypothetical protein